MKQPKTFKKFIRIEGCDVRIRTRKCGKDLSFELRYRKNGINISASAKDKEIAIKKFTEKLKSALAMNSGFPQVPSDFHNFSMYYFENFRKRLVTPTTYNSDLNKYNLNVKPYLENIPLKKIMPLQCQVRYYLSITLKYALKRHKKECFSALFLIEQFFWHTIWHSGR